MRGGAAAALEVDVDGKLGRLTLEHGAAAMMHAERLALKGARPQTDCDQRHHGIAPVSHAY